MEDKNILKAVRKNEFYDIADLPALEKVSNSKSWIGVIFWYIIFVVFSALCIVSVIKQMNEYADNPTKTDVANIRATTIRVPNISLCLTGWRSLSTDTLWTPTIESAADSPTWPYLLPAYVGFELELMK